MNIKYEATGIASQDIEKQLYYLKEQIVKIWAISACMSFSVIKYELRDHILQQWSR